MSDILDSGPDSDSGPDLDPARVLRMAALGLGLLVVLGLLLGGYHQVPEGHVGVQKSFGAVTGDELEGLVEVLLRRANYDERTQEFFRLASKKAALEAAHDGTLEDHEEYRQLTDRMNELQGQLNRTLTELNEDDFEAAFRSLPGGQGGELSH